MIILKVFLQFLKKLYHSGQKMQDFGTENAKHNGKLKIES